MKNKTIEIWEKDKYQSEAEDGFKPVLDTYILSGAKKRGAVLIFPGGGYEFTSEREAEPVAMQFNAAGYHAFVLYYSVSPRRHPQPLLDALRAMCIIRENADEWNVDPNRVAVCGFSAGGHLAASLGVHWDDPDIAGSPEINVELGRPDAMILCYPVITSGRFAHRDSFERLLGKEADKKLLSKMSLELHVSKNTPPAFIWHTFDDGLVPVENSLLLAQAMRSFNIPFELHVYPRGPHGLSLATEETGRGEWDISAHVSTWLGLSIQWLEEVFS